METIERIKNDMKTNNGKHVPTLIEKLRQLQIDNYKTYKNIAMNQITKHICPCIDLIFDSSNNVNVTKLMRVQ